MRSLIFSLYVIGICNTVIAQEFREKLLPTQIREATVFLNGAQVFENGTTNLPSGKTVLQVRNLSPYINQNSIQVKGEGEFTILSVNHQINHINELKKSEQIDSLKKAIESLTTSIARDNAKLESIRERQSVLVANRSLGGSAGGATIAQLKLALDFHESELLKIKEEEIKINKSIEQKKLELTKLEQQLAALNQQQFMPSSDIEIRVEANKAGNANFIISYLVSNAGWQPKYDIRSDNVNSPLNVIYKAAFYQNTGVDWKNVKLKFSNGEPNRSGVLPILNTWNLDFARNIILRGVSTFNDVVIKEEDTRESEMRKRAAPMLMADAEIPQTTAVENQTTVEIEIQEPYTINSGSEQLTVDLKKFQVNADYEYVTIPKLDKDAFLVAKISQWDQYNLIDGEANLYFEDGYVGKTWLNTKSLEDTMSISLGRDKSIVVSREKVAQYAKTKTIGNNVTDSRGIKITVRNKKSLPVKIKIMDQIPKSVTSEIIVNPIELSNGNLDILTGKILWELNIDKQQQKEIIFQYEVRYPKKGKVILD
ncbi:MAG: DUF4139 domain-containing protein [Chitinophagaceae bacterium]